MKKILSVLLTLVMVFCFTGCSSSSKEDKTDGTDSSKETGTDMKAAVILGIGGLGDQSYNDLVYSGLERAKEELGVDFDYAEPKEVTDFETILRDMSDSGEYAVIIGIAFDQLDAFTTVVPDYPDQQYALIDATLLEDNVASYASKEQEGAFLVGALAAYMKQDASLYNLEDNHKYGFVGAMESETIDRFAAGYQAGIQYVDPEADVTIQYVGGDNPFGDTTTAKEISNSQYAKGHDIIFHAAGGSGLGVFAAAKESDFIAIGVNSNQNTIDPDHIAASMLKRVDNAAYDIIESTLGGKLKTGEETVLGLSDEGIGYTLEGSNIKVSDEITERLEKMKEKIINGEIVVPSEL